MVGSKDSVRNFMRKTSSPITRAITINDKPRFWVPNIPKPKAHGNAKIRSQWRLVRLKSFVDADIDLFMALANPWLCSFECQCNRREDEEYTWDHQQISDALAGRRRESNGDAGKCTKCKSYFGPVFGPRTPLDIYFLVQSNRDSHACHNDIRS